MKKDDSTGCLPLILSCILFLLMALAFIPFSVIFILLLPFGINAFELMDKIGSKKSNEIKEDSENPALSKFITNFNYNNRTNFNANAKVVDLCKESTKCLIYYLTNKDSIIQTPITPNGYITLHNHKYRDIGRRPQNSTHKLNECNLGELVEAVKKNDLILFYTSLFNTPSDAFSLENKISIAKNIKSNNHVNVTILSTYIDTDELWSNEFILDNGMLKMKCRDYGCASDFE